MTWCFHTSLQFPKGHLSFVDKWPLMNPNEIAFILVTYLLFILKIGRLLMEGRPPFHIKGFLIFYNGIKVVNSSVLAYKFLSYMIDKGIFPRKCEHDESTIYLIASLYWKYMATKILDLCDTIFFVIRKKYSQVTFLHVYHHTFMVVIVWTFLKYDPSDHWAFMAFMNCAIHTVMYTYYGISVLGPQFHKYLWWKKYVTIVQLVQFCLVIGHLVIQTSTSQCPMHTSSYWMGLSNLALFVGLFADFYKRRYINKDESVTELACTNKFTD